MTGTFFLDSSALIKLYHQEAGTDRVDELFASAEATLIISELAEVEVSSAVARKVRSGEISAQAEEAVIQNFEQDCADRFVIEPLSHVVVQQAKANLRKYGQQSGLRTLDAL